MTSTFDRMASSDTTILLTGNTGTGKSFLAKQLHLMSARRDKKFSAINLATLSENLIESELFGHERGAFSGAETKRIGKIEITNGGTVFLDEIGELSLRLQTKLLEVLNSKTISPVGSNREFTLNIRFIVATNKNLRTMVKECLFREDLFYRINTFSLHLPNIAGDREKIETLSERFLNEAALQQNRTLATSTAGFKTLLFQYTWPGNIRELKNAMDFAVAISSCGILDEGCIPPYIREYCQAPVETIEAISALTSSQNQDYQTAKTNFERKYITQALRNHSGRINLTARQSGISKVTLIEKIRRYEINVNEIKYQSYQERKLPSCIATIA